MLFGFILWGGYHPVRHKALGYIRQRKELRTLRSLTIYEIVVVSLTEQLREKTLHMKPSETLAQSLECKGIIKRTTNSLLAETLTRNRAWYSDPEPPAFEYVETVWQLVIKMDEFKVDDLDALRAAIADEKRGDELKTYLSPKHPTILQKPWRFGNIFDNFRRK